MRFGAPEFLTAFLVLLIPVIVHLFHFRRYRLIKFPDLRFLKNIQTEQKNRNNLRHLLVLASRICGLSCLVLAFALPTCQKSRAVADKKRIAVFLDNSGSMSRRAKAGLLFETAKSKAREILKAEGNNAEFMIVSHNPQRDPGYYYSLQEASDFVDHLDICYNPRPFREIYSEIVSGKGPDEFYVISDFQRNFISQMPPLDSGRNMDITGVIVEGGSEQNYSIDTAWLSNPFSIPGEKNQLNFRLKNYSNKDVKALNVRLETGTAVTGLAQLDLAPEGTAEGTIDFITPNGQSAEAKLITEPDDFPLDNELYLAFNGQNKVNIALSPGSVFIDSALSKNNFYKLNRGGDLMSDLRNVDVVYLAYNYVIQPGNAEKIKQFLMDGGTVVLYPSAKEVPPATLNRILPGQFGIPEIRDFNNSAYKISKEGLGNPFYKQVFRSIPENIEMPPVKNYYSTAGSLGNGESILNLENGDPFLLKFQIGKGQLFWFSGAPDPDGGEFYHSVLFFPTITNCALPENKRLPLFQYASSGETVPLKNKYSLDDGMLVLKTPMGEMVPEVQYGTGNEEEIYIFSGMNQPGYYVLSEKNSNQSEVLALNASRVESNLETADEALRSQLSKNTGIKWVDAAAFGPSRIMVAGDRGLWNLFIWFAAVFFALEVLLLSVKGFRLNRSVTR